MKLKGSCHCQAVVYECESNDYLPYQLCYCSICRKTQGGGGYTINLSADARTLKIHKGRKAIGSYNALVLNEETGRRKKSSGERKFCMKCASALWLFDPSWPDLIHPFASSIDSELPPAPEHTHVMMEFKMAWVKPHALKKDQKFKLYPKESIAEWHDRVLKRK
ncbi:MAG: GFA family protein [Proteobacteria bacterium]|nr:MAG: GFA family protein [Pseudomonadota bacterium]